MDLLIGSKGMLLAQVSALDRRTGGSGNPASDGGRSTHWNQETGLLSRAKPRFGASELRQPAHSQHLLSSVPGRPPTGLLMLPIERIDIFRNTPTYVIVLLRRQQTDQQGYEYE